MPNVIAGWVSTEAQVSKYDPLRDYLKKQTRDDFVLTFEEIEVIGLCAAPLGATRGMVGRGA